MTHRQFRIFLAACCALVTAVTIYEAVRRGNAAGAEKEFWDELTHGPEELAAARMGAEAEPEEEGG